MLSLLLFFIASCCHLRRWFQFVTVMKVHPYVGEAILTQLDRWMWWQNIYVGGWPVILFDWKFHHTQASYCCQKPKYLFISNRPVVIGGNIIFCISICASSGVINEFVWPEQFRKEQLQLVLDGWVIRKLQFCISSAKHLSSCQLLDIGSYG